MLTVDPTVGRAETLRRSMLSMITTGKDYEAHPAFWAPFVLVGEGARQIDFAHNVLAWWGNIMSLRNRIVLIGLSWPKLTRATRLLRRTNRRLNLASCSSVMILDRGVTKLYCSSIPGASKCRCGHIGRPTRGVRHVRELSAALRDPTWRQHAGPRLGWANRCRSHCLSDRRHPRSAGLL